MTHTCLDGKTAVGLIECWCTQRYTEYRLVTKTTLPGPLVQQDNGTSNRRAGYPVQTSTVAVSSSGRLSNPHRPRRREHMSARRRRHGAKKSCQCRRPAALDCCTVEDGRWASGRRARHTRRHTRRRSDESSETTTRTTTTTARGTLRARSVHGGGDDDDDDTKRPMSPPAEQPISLTTHGRFSNGETLLRSPRPQSRSSQQSPEHKVRW